MLWPRSAVGSSAHLNTNFTQWNSEALEKYLVVILLPFERDVFRSLNVLLLLEPHSVEWRDFLLLSNKRFNKPFK